MKYALVARSLSSLSLSLFLSSLLPNFPCSFPSAHSRCRAWLPLFAFVPQCALYPLSALRESKLRRSAGWPAVLPRIYIAPLRTPDILRRFDLCETFAKYPGLNLRPTRKYRRRGRARTRASERERNEGRDGFPEEHGANRTCDAGVVLYKRRIATREGPSLLDRTQ